MRRPNTHISLYTRLLLLHVSPTLFSKTIFTTSLEKNKLILLSTSNAIVLVSEEDKQKRHRGRTKSTHLTAAEYVLLSLSRHIALQFALLHSHLELTLLKTFPVRPHTLFTQSKAWASQFRRGQLCGVRLAPQQLEALLGDATKSGPQLLLIDIR